MVRAKDGKDFSDVDFSFLLFEICFYKMVAVAAVTMDGGGVGLKKMVMVLS